MSCFLKSMSDTTLSIPNIVEVENVTFYEILIQVGTVCWTVLHRFKDFVELHEKLVSERSISKDLLPPKKLMGNKNPSFLEKRKNGLEKYLQEVLVYLQLTMPREFVEFLKFHEYDIIFLLQTIAQSFYQNGDLYLAMSKSYTFSVLELFAISERLKLPCHSLEISEKQFDFSHVLDFCSKLESIKIFPTKQTKVSLNYDVEIENKNSDASVPLGTSNIIPAHLKFNLIAFKNLQNVTLLGVPAENIYNTGIIRKTLKSFCVHNTKTSKMNEILLCDDIHRNAIDDPEKIWTTLETVDFSGNEIDSIDASIQLLPNIKNLILNKNQVTNVTNLRSRALLSNLSLCENKISCCIEWHLEVGNLVSLILSQNFIPTLIGFRKMYSLVNLDLSCNLITNIDEVDHIGNLPCLENIKLTGNPVAGTVDYRAKVLSRFTDRLSEIYLDNEKASQMELDTALVLAALRLSQQKGISPKKVSDNLGFGT